MANYGDFQQLGYIFSHLIQVVFHLSEATGIQETSIYYCSITDPLTQ